MWFLVASALALDPAAIPPEPTARVVEEDPNGPAPYFEPATRGGTVYLDALPGTWRAEPWRAVQLVPGVTSRNLAEAAWLLDGARLDDEPRLLGPDELRAPSRLGPVAPPPGLVQLPGVPGGARR